MAAPSGAHVSIGGVKYLLAEDLDEHYAYSGTVERAPQDVLGGKGKIDVDSDERLLWRMSDWSGGEGNRHFDVNDPSVYHYSEDTSTTQSSSGGGVNGRIPGQISGRPSRTKSDEKTVTDNAQIPLLCTGDGNLWMGSSKELWAAGSDGTHFGDTWDGTSWVSITHGAGANNSITAMGGTYDAVYVAFFELSDTSTPARQIRRITIDSTTGTTGSHLVASADGSGSVPLPYRGHLIYYHGRLYGWTGVKLDEFDVADGSSLTKNVYPGWRTAYNTGTGTESFNAFKWGNNNNYESWWTDICQGNNVIYMMTGNPSASHVYIFENGVGRPYWTAPMGFTARSIAFVNGTLFVCGHWSEKQEDASSGWGALYALPQMTGQEIFVGHVRAHTNSSLNLQVACSSYGGQIMFAGANQGKVFIYDSDYDAISLLDDLPFTFAGSNYKIGDMITHQGRRVATVYAPRTGGSDPFSLSTTKIFAYSWLDDNPPNRQAVIAGDSPKTEPLYSPWFDFNMPYDSKLLYGIHVSFDVEGATTSGLLSGQSITVSYDADGDGATFTSAGTIDSSTSVNQKGKAFLVVSSASSAVKFNRLRLKIGLKATTGVQLPIVTDVTVDARSLDVDQTWDLKLRLKDEQSGTRRTGNKDSAETQRVNIRSAFTTKSPVTFLDYYAYSKARNESNTHTVTVDAIRDIIDRNGEGYMQVRLRKLRT